MMMKRTTRSALRALTIGSLFYWLSVVMVIVAGAQDSNNSYHYNISNCAGQDAFVFYERCDGNSVTQVYGDCANSTIHSVISHPCGRSYDLLTLGEVFPYCHECGGRAVCSNQEDEEAVCADVVTERCEKSDDNNNSNSTNYGLGVYPQTTDSTFGVGFVVCLDGAVEYRGDVALSTASCESLYSSATPYYLICAGAVGFCVDSGMTTCSDLGLEEVDASSLSYEPHVEPCPVTDGVYADVYYEQCIGDHTIFQIFGTCDNPSALSTSCTDWSGQPSFYYCHDCFGKHVCSDNPSTELVCASVEQGICIGSSDDDDNGSSSVIDKQVGDSSLASLSPVNYLVSDFPCIDDSSYSLINRLCLNGTVTEYSLYSDVKEEEPPDTTICSELNPETQVCLNCVGTFGILDACVRDGVTCSDLGPITADLETTLNDNTAPPGLVTGKSSSVPPEDDKNNKPLTSNPATLSANNHDIQGMSSAVVGTRELVGPGVFVVAFAGVFLSCY